jgi:putative phosphoserine phosphatase/1-acylglycerol-3-phosphate O-acyltransferase
MVFVDREARDGAAQLAPALRALREGRTLAIAPEGSRSFGTRPGAFKRGAFYLARRARVPLVPVVIHNAADVLPRGAALLRSDVPVEVTVLPPMDAARWRARELGGQADALHARYLDALGFAPAGASPDEPAPAHARRASGLPLAV